MRTTVTLRGGASHRQLADQMSYSVEEEKLQDLLSYNTLFTELSIRKNLRNFVFKAGPCVVDRLQLHHHAAKVKKSWQVSPRTEKACAWTIQQRRWRVFPLS